jgi:hypothetical protein
VEGGEHLSDTSSGAKAVAVGEIGFQLSAATLRTISPMGEMVNRTR